MNPETDIVASCLQVTQPLGTFYSTVLDAKDLIVIAHTDVRRLIARDVELYLGIQRPLDEKRAKEIGKYTNTIDAAFPTGIILYISPEHIEYDPERKTIRIARRADVAKVLDGQHRIAGLEYFAGPKFEVNVVIFVDMDIEDQANVFATINLQQTKVNKSLVYDLFAFAKTRSPQRTCHEICRLLNHHEGSPLKDRIKILGFADPIRKETLTQAGFVEQLLPYITNDARADRDALRRGRSLPKIDFRIERSKCIFRSYFEAEKDEYIARILWNYFTAISLRWEDGWKQMDPGNVLVRSTGFIAFMRLLRPLYQRLTLEGKGDIPATNDFLSELKKVRLEANDFRADKYLPGSGGQAALFKDFILQLGLADA